MTTSYICVDVETTGLDPKDEKLIEIGAVKVIDGEITERFQSFVAPGRCLEARISELTNITDEMLEHAPQPAEILPQFWTFCEELPLLGHHIAFDYAFLKKAMVQEKLPFEKKGLDTLRISRKYLPELESRSLEYLCQHFAIAHTAHRALGDAQATVALYTKLCDLFYERAQAEECKVFVPAPLNYQVKREKPITIAQKEQIARYCTALGINLNRDINTMTRSEASRFVERYRLEMKALEQRHYEKTN